MMSIKSISMITVEISMSMSIWTIKMMIIQSAMLLIMTMLMMMMNEIVFYWMFSCRKHIPRSVSRFEIDDHLVFYQRFHVLLILFFLFLSFLVHWNINLCLMPSSMLFQTMIAFRLWGWDKIMNRIMSKLKKKIHFDKLRGLGFAFINNWWWQSIDS